MYNRLSTEIKDIDKLFNPTFFMALEDVAKLNNVNIRFVFLRASNRDIMKEHSIGQSPAAIRALTIGKAKSVISNNFETDHLIAPLPYTCSWLCHVLCRAPCVLCCGLEFPFQGAVPIKFLVNNVIENGVAAVGGAPGSNMDLAILKAALVQRGFRQLPDSEFWSLPPENENVLAT